MKLIITTPKFGTTIWFLSKNKAVRGVLIGHYGSYHVDKDREPYFSKKYKIKVNQEYLPLLDDESNGVEHVSTDAAFLSKQDLLKSL